jgi:hypothetical protein
MSCAVVHFTVNRVCTGIVRMLRKTSEEVRGKLGKLHNSYPTPNNTKVVWAELGIQHVG